ncbi:MAG TPA: hypothetical protein VGN79_06585 [Devosia sp.]|jgi:hypothetical protein|nr:hypothetical protein [Devosia sp.]
MNGFEKAPHENDLTSMISENVLQDMIDAATPLRLAPSVNLDALRYEIARLFADAYNANSWRRMSRQDRNKLLRFAEVLSSYEEISRRSIHTHFPPPLLPPGWLKNLERWVKDVNVWFPPGDPGGAPNIAWRGVFYPRILAIFKVVFGQEPTSTISTIDDDAAGPTVSFLRAVTKEMARARIQHPFEPGAVCTSIKSPKLTTLKSAVTDFYKPASDSFIDPDYVTWCEAYTTGAFSLSRQLT